jgi:hypothetical protein
MIVAQPKTVKTIYLKREIVNTALRKSSGMLLNGSVGR